MKKSKNTKRFSFQANTNDSSHQAGANTVSISIKDYDTSNTKGYSTSVGTVTPGQSVVMTVKEAKAFQNFLNQCFTISND
tara:strand:+ start:1628 stop:1867 length:240 start_codon:yes stop_codon:yes gene_type:complete